MQKKNNIHSVIIIGSGPAGYTAYIYAARANLFPVLITGNNIGGQLTTTQDIENWPGEIKKISGSDLMNRMRQHAEKFSKNIIEDHIQNVNFKTFPFVLNGEKKKYFSKTVIIATGAIPRHLGLSSEVDFQGKGVSYCATCDGFFFKNQIVAVIGGGNTAIEEVLYLTKIVKKIYLIHRNSTFKAEKILIQRMRPYIHTKKIIIYKNYVVKEILGNELGVNTIYIQSNLNKNITKKIQVSGIFIAIGHIPNTNLFHQQLKTENGYILVKYGNHGFFTQTSIPGIFAAGDVIDHVYKQAITSAASGCMAALDVDRYLDQNSQ
ncbi:thioredoxin-disulfide reductase [Buchnera aphidicola (Thelaxes californica)]|uniref:Thioredoxin reductase n=1 Tax=Buchnera aphidicola (Thelaxes californica) TaxID=1315998 RepID=A0A4D6YNX9_9GAMM|nr:thioredoxin-disulfide reductase [Buchnera aphidicola]QCI26775.1 thioredoxin-disulfide reductase [Buchnera aphidicola (Thelaxes californica)]